MSAASSRPGPDELPVVPFICSPLHVRELPGFTPTIGAVLDAIIFFAGSDYECAPLVSELVERSGVSRASVARGVTWLKEHQVIAEVVDPRVGARRWLQLLWRRRPSRGGTHQQSSASQGGASASQRGASSSQGGASASQRGAPSLYLDLEGKEEEEHQEAVGAIPPQDRGTEPKAPPPPPSGADARAWGRYALGVADSAAGRAATRQAVCLAGGALFGRLAHESPKVAYKALWDAIDGSQADRRRLLDAYAAADHKLKIGGTPSEAGACFGNVWSRGMPPLFEPARGSEAESARARTAPAGGASPPAGAGTLSSLAEQASRSRSGRTPESRPPEQEGPRRYTEAELAALIAADPDGRRRRLARFGVAPPA